MASYEFFTLAKGADRTRHLRSAILLNVADNTYWMIKIPRYAFVHTVVWETLAVYGSSSTMTVGFAGNGETADPDAFILSADIDPDHSTRLTTGLEHATGINRSGKWFDAEPGAITVTMVIGNGAATASGRVWVGFDVIHK